MSGGTLLLLLNLLFALAFFLYEHFLEGHSSFKIQRKGLRAIKKKEDTSYSYVPDSLFAFDPNELSLKGWKALGLTKDQARVIINYRKSGGRFSSKEDLLRVYSVRKAHVRAWGDSLLFPKDDTPSKDRSKKGVSEEGKDKGPKEEAPMEPSPFDPNRIPKKKWVRLGLSPKQAEVVIRFRKAGGKFWEASDLLQLYVVDTPLYQKWQPYVKIDRSSLKVPIDHAEKQDLMSLPGIGKKRAGWILKYRKLLGGFHRKDQLREVYGIPDSVLKPLMERVKVRGGGIDPIPTDTTARGLMEHPYIEPECAEAIVEYRERYGSFESKRELQELDLLNTEEYRKIAPYLELPSHEQ